MLLLIAAATALALISLGGGIYEFVVVDPQWPRNPVLIQPQRGGISRKHFWIPAHTLFELVLVGALIAAWREGALRTPLLLALGAHALMRVWSAVDFIPKALAFERAEPGAVSEVAARRWVRRSRLRLTLDLFTCAALGYALLNAATLVSS